MLNKSIDQCKNEMLNYLDVYKCNVSKAARQVGICKNFHYWWTNKSNSNKTKLKRYDENYHKNVKKILLKHKKDRNVMIVIKTKEYIKNRFLKKGGEKWLIDLLKK